MSKIVSMLVAVAAMALWGSAATAEDYAGKIEKFEMHGLTVHAYNSAEGMQDGSVVFETEANLVLLEPQSMPASAKELKRYIDALNKPLAAVIVSYHGAGLKAYENVPIYASAATLDFIKQGGQAGLFGYFADTVPGFDPTTIVPNHTLTEPNARIGGIDFALKYDDAPAPAPGMSVSVPSAKIVYLHMLGGDTHSILGSTAHIDAFIADLCRIQSDGCELILTSHHTPERPEALGKKIAYLEATRKIFGESATKEAFLAAMKKTFPHYQGEGYLEMTAGNLYPQQK